MRCQLQEMPASLEPLDVATQLRLRLAQDQRRLREAWNRPWRELLRRARRPEPDPVPPPVGAGADEPPLGLEPGDAVQVKSLDEIEATLDARGRCHGLAFTPEMRPFCGQHHTVRQRVHCFFDERRWQMLRLRRVVILEGVYCEPAASSYQGYGGCDRCCFLFWREDWLRRA